MQVVKPADLGIASSPLRRAVQRAKGVGRTAIAAVGLSVSLLVIFVAPSRAAEAAPGEAPRLRAREWLVLGVLALAAACIARSAASLG